MDPLGHLRNDFQVHLEDGLTHRYIFVFENIISYRLDD
jgi:hypothetical protein